jgi:hypothetical protein
MATWGGGSIYQYHLTFECINYFSSPMQTNDNSQPRDSSNYVFYQISEIAIMQAMLRHL